MNTHFQCTKCGNCCRKLKLPLSVAEAVAWLEDGNDVQVLCEAIPWPGELPASNLVAAYKRERSFAALSGSLPLRVIVTLVAPLDDACPNLQDDLNCAIYERRPNVCRTYPAEINPFLQLLPAQKLCPPEAWTPAAGSFHNEAGYIDPMLRRYIQSIRDSDVGDVSIKEAVCSRLRIDATAMANEGYVMHAPDRASLLAALTDGAGLPLPDPKPWRFVSDRAETVGALVEAGSDCSLAADMDGSAVKYLSLFAGAAG